MNKKIHKDYDPLPGDLAIWIFIFAELLVFALFFIGYVITRSYNIDLFNESQLTLNAHIGAINTVLLISSSYFVVHSIRAIDRNNINKSAIGMLLAIICACLFLILKSYEFYGKFSAGITLSTNTFYMFYLSLTFFHYMHVILGLVILVALWVNIRSGKYTADSKHGLESGAAYWHMVDLVWIVMFPLVYVIH